jgi:hypothetical protein
LIIFIRSPIGIFAIGLSVRHLEIDLIVAFQSVAIIRSNGRLIGGMIGVSSPDKLDEIGPRGAISAFGANLHSILETICDGPVLFSGHRKESEKHWVSRFQRRSVTFWVIPFRGEERLPGCSTGGNRRCKFSNDDLSGVSAKLSIRERVFLKNKRMQEGEWDSFRSSFLVILLWEMSLSEKRLVYRTR